MDGMDRYLDENDKLWAALAYGIELYCWPSLRELAQNTTKIMYLNAIDEFTEVEQEIIMKNILKSGNLAGFQELEKNYFSIPSGMESYAIYSGNLTLVKYIAEKVCLSGSEWRACQYGKREIYDWLKSQYYENDNTALYDVRGGDFEKFQDMNVKFKNKKNPMMAIWQYKQHLINAEKLCFIMLRSRNRDWIRLVVRLLEPYPGHRLLPYAAKFYGIFKKILHLWREYDINDNFSYKFANYGNVKGLRFMKKHGIEIKNNVCTMAAAADQPHVIEWAFKNGEETSYNEIFANCFSYKMLKFIDEFRGSASLRFGDEIDDYEAVNDFIEGVVEKHDLKAIRWIQEHGYLKVGSFNNKILENDEIYLFKELDIEFPDKLNYNFRFAHRIVRYMGHFLVCNAHQHTLESAIRTGNLYVVKRFVENGGEWNENCLRYAFGLIEISNWIREQDLPQQSDIDWSCCCLHAAHADAPNAISLCAARTNL